MRRILVVDDDLHVGQATGFAFADMESSGSEFLRLATRLGATRCLRKPFKPAILLDVIDECLSEADPHRRQVAALSAVADSLSGLPAKPTASQLATASPRDPRLLGERLS